MEQKHKWAKEIIAWLNGEKVQFCNVDCENWRNLGDHNLDYPLNLFDNKNLKFRIAPKTIKINGHEVPEPYQFSSPISDKEELEYGTEYFCPCISYPDGYGSFCWNGYRDNFYHLNAGIVHLTKEAAIKHAEALLSFTKEVE